MDSLMDFDPVKFEICVKVTSHESEQRYEHDGLLERQSFSATEDVPYGSQNPVYSCIVSISQQTSVQYS